MAKKQSSKALATLSHKVPAHTREAERATWLAWVNLYFETVVTGGSPRTAEAKRRDLQKFLTFFTAPDGKGPGVDQVDAWTPSVTKAFQREIGKEFRATSVNRCMATLRHFARWLNREDRHKLLAGDPFEGQLSSSAELLYSRRGESARW